MIPYGWERIGSRSVLAGLKSKSAVDLNIEDEVRVNMVYELRCPDGDCEFEALITTEEETKSAKERHDERCEREALKREK